MPRTERSIEIGVPVSQAYNQWTRFEELPKFMDGVREVRRTGENRLHWKAEILGKDKEWDAEITEQIPNQRVAWRSVTGARNAGTVIFESLPDNKTKLTVHMDYEPEGVVEQVGDLLGILSQRVQQDLSNFKTLIEGRGVEEMGGMRRTR